MAQCVVVAKSPVTTCGRSHCAHAVVAAIRAAIIGLIVDGTTHGHTGASISDTFVTRGRGARPYRRLLSGRTHLACLHLRHRCLEVLRLLARWRKEMLKPEEDPAAAPARSGDRAHSPVAPASPASFIQHTEPETYLERFEARLSEALCVTDVSQIITEAQPPFRIVHVNQAWCDMCGFPAEAAVGHQADEKLADCIEDHKLGDHERDLFE